MRLRVIAAASLTAVLTAMVYATPARALGPVDVEIGARAGFATDFNNGGPPNPFGFGIGGRAGVSILGIYAGFVGMYSLGSSATLVGGRVNESLSSAMEGAELGYTFKVWRLRIRPQLGLGNLSIVETDPPSSQSYTTHYLYIEPSGVVMLPIGVFFVGADVGVVLAPPVTRGDFSEGYFAFEGHTQLGVRF